ncbi:SLAC1 anion channel family protein [Variovorax sp. HJSM1_2]|uniref:SLAC1 anion channel family protein n=1 Tax=Variovorax sp. HJSM1_2 TaxID=3366263 RepID=UPI003BDF59D3
MSSPSTHPAAPVLSARSGASVRHLPVNLFGAVMSLCGLALAWRLAHRSLGAPAWLAEAISIFAVAVFVLVSFAYLSKLLRHADAVYAEFQHPVAGNFFGTIVISLLLLSAVVEPHNAPLARGIWLAGVLSTFALSWLAMSRLLKGQVDAAHAVPAMLIPGVATLDIPVTGTHMPMAWAAELNLMAGAVGAVLALVLLVMIVSRLVHRDPLALGITPSLMILVAPFAVGFLAYSNITGGVDRFAGVLFYFGLFMFAVLAPKVFRPSVAFTPAWWAVGFPMAALANAALRYAEFRASQPLWLLATLLLGLLSGVLAVLTLRTLQLVLGGKLFR